jgi:signal transduction histidine kinase
MRASTLTGEGRTVPDSAQRRRLWYGRGVLLAGLAAILAAMIASRGALSLHGAGLKVAIALGVASVSWLALVLTGPRGDTTVLRVLTACTAVSGSVLLLLYPSLAVYWFTFWGCFNAGVCFPTPVGAAITGGSAAILVGGWLDQRGNILAAFAAVAFVGYVIGRNRRQYIGLASLAAAAADEREREAARAERERIARELHDVLGHSLTGVSMQIESAAAILESTADADRALSYLDNAGKLVRTGQQEADAAVRTLRAGQVTVDEMIGGLIDMQRAGGARVQFTTTGTPSPLDADPALALYRVAQEALTNAAKHAPGEPVEVGLSYTAGAVRVCVVNDSVINDSVINHSVNNHRGPGARDPVGGGHGLLGMRERMTAVGGTVSAGRVGSRWQVEAQVSV